MDLIVALGVLLALTVAVTVVFKQFFLPKNVSDTSLAGLSEFDKQLVKKAPDVDVHRYRKYPLIVGMFVTLVFAMTMVEYKTYSIQEIIQKADVSQVFDEMLDIPITEMPPPEPPKPKTSMVMEVVKDEELVEEEEQEMIQDEELEEEEAFIEEIEEEVVEEEIEPQIHIRVEQQAEPSGGMRSFQSRLMTGISEQFGVIGTDYPQGVVYLQFVIMEDGRVSNVRVAKGVHPKVDNMVLSEFKKSAGRWSPGRIQGQPVRQMKNFPVRIKFD